MPAIDGTRDEMVVVVMMKGEFESLICTEAGVAPCFVAPQQSTVHLKCGDARGVRLVDSELAVVEGRISAVLQDQGEPQCLRPAERIWTTLESQAQ
ncbi:MAG: hypothetical protein K8J08_12940 [Thermoanaerobaculia bacterium]|nr:hypothetical protein [Thermoanaerobaculia bacterium]